MEGDGGGEATGMTGSRRPRILIVDDEPAIVDALRDTLRDRGYDPVGFTDATAALAGLEAGQFDLLLADLTMPRIGGVDLLREAQRRDPDLVGVIMTGDGTIATAVEAMKTGALDYILKPLKMSVILPVLSRALTVRRLRTENAELARSVGERTAQLEAALRDLESQTAERLRAEQALMQAQKLEAVGRLTGGVAHNFNNLLMAIDGALQLLDKRLDPEHAGRKYVDCARQATERGAKVTSELLAFSRTQRFDLRSTEIRRALQAGQSIFAQAMGPTIRFSLELGDDEIWAMTDPDQLELAIVNLAINARDALPDGGNVTLGLTTEDAVAPVVAVWLRDTGIGMSNDTAARALEPFFTTKERGKGTGLGLAQVYGFARQCGGEVRIDSAPGMGTTITVILPRAAPPAVLDPQPKAAAPGILERAARTEGVRLLVVDDDDAVRQILVDGLRLEGFEVAEAIDGETGLQALRRERPDALVVDYAMPGMNGAEVAKQARALRPGLPVVFCSGYADTLALDDIEDAPLVRKPVVISALGRMVVDLIARRSA